MQAGVTREHLNAEILCPNCGAGELKNIAVILERPVIERILTHLG
jgi:hypothetical protein